MSEGKQIAGLSWGLDFNHRVPTVRESQGILSESGKVGENREGQGKVGEF